MDLTIVFGNLDGSRYPRHCTHLLFWNGTKFFRARWRQGHNNIHYCTESFASTFPQVIVINKTLVLISRLGSLKIIFGQLIAIEKITRLKQIRAYKLFPAFADVWAISAFVSPRGADKTLKFVYLQAQE